MPIKYVQTITRYGCKFKCGWRRQRRIPYIEDHEKKCWLNPANKCCQTCKHEGIEYDEWRYQECNHPNTKVREKLEELYEATKNPMCWILNCEHWEQED